MKDIKAPHLRTEAKSIHMELDVLLLTAALCLYSAFTYGFRPILIVLISIVSAVITEWICLLIQGKKGNRIGDGTAAVTGAIIGLLMSPIVPYWVPVVGSVFAIAIVKVPFGGTGRNVFNPAAAGLAFLSYCFPNQLFTYPAVNAGTLPLVSSVPDTVVTETSVAAQLRAGAAPMITRLHLLLGEFSGPIGATATFILFACAVYLLIRRTASLWMMAPYFATCFLIAALNRQVGLSFSSGVMMQLCGGYVLFAGVFLLNDPVTSPRFWLGRLFYGFFAACLVMLLQRVGRVEAGSCFAILLMNILSPIIDRWSWHIWRWITQRIRIRREVNAHG